MESADIEESNSLLYKVMVNRRIVEKVQMNMNSIDMSVKNEVCLHCDEEADKLRKLNKDLEIKYNDTFRALDNVRKNALEATERILDKEFKIAFLEKALHGCEHNLKETNDKLKKSQGDVEIVKIECKREMSILETQVERLCQVVKEKDNKILSLINDLSKSSVELREIRGKKDELTTQLKSMCDNLNNVINATNEREQMLNTLECDLKKKEVERQGLYLNEINRSRRLFINIKVKENLMSQIIQGKNNHINELRNEILLLKDKLARITKTFNELSLPKADIHRSVTIKHQENNNIECKLKSPCNMRMISGNAKLVL